MVNGMRLGDLDELSKVFLRYPSMLRHSGDFIAVNLDAVLFEIRRSPTIDAVPVVRCAECKHWGGITFGNVCRRWSAPLAGMKNCTRADDFCSYGEKKENTDG